MLMMKVYEPKGPEREYLQEVYVLKMFMDNPLPKSQREIQDVFEHKFLIFSSISEALRRLSRKRTGILLKRVNHLTGETEYFLNPCISGLDLIGD